MAEDSTVYNKAYDEICYRTGCGMLGISYEGIVRGWSFARRRFEFSVGFDESINHLIRIEPKRLGISLSEMQAFYVKPCNESFKRTFGSSEVRQKIVSILHQKTRNNSLSLKAWPLFFPPQSSSSWRLVPIWNEGESLESLAIAYDLRNLQV